MVSMGRRPISFRLERSSLEELERIVESYPMCTGRSELIRNLVNSYLEYEFKRSMEDDEQ